MKAYISGTGSISPVEHFNRDMTIPNIEKTDNSFPFFISKEPAYKDYINPMQLRRMSRVMKMGITSAMLCLKDAGTEVPEAIITATGLGCVEDSDKFLSALIVNEEKMLNPTPFIQSTHNTIGSQIALQLKCHGYNSTYAGRGACFEMALLDSLMLLNEGEAKNVLVGSYDEITPNLVTILHRLGLFRANHYNKVEYSGNIPGEGASFGLLSLNSGKNDYAVLQGVTIFPRENNLTEELEKFISSYGIGMSNMDVIITGQNSEVSDNSFYSNLNSLISEEQTLINFKKYCGEYLTASAFAFWMASHILKSQTIPASSIIKKGNREEIKNILIVNNSLGNQYSAILLTKC